jgi:hypothetical protein
MCLRGDENASPCTYFGRRWCCICDITRLAQNRRATLPKPIRHSHQVPHQKISEHLNDTLYRSSRGTLRTLTVGPLTLQYVSVQRPTPDAYTTLAIKTIDESFFRVRFDRLAPPEKGYLRAMAELGRGTNVRERSPESAGLTVQSVSPVHGDTAFTVPLFGNFLRRVMPVPGPGVSQGKKEFLSRLTHQAFGRDKGSVQDSPIREVTPILLIW